MKASLDAVWQSQRRWSTLANTLKRNLGAARKAVLALTIAGAVLVTLGATVTGFDEPAGQILGIAGAIALALAPVIGSRSGGQPQVRDWVRARSISEALKTEVYCYLTRTGSYAAAADSEAELERRRRDLLKKVVDLGPRAEGVTPDAKADRRLVCKRLHALRRRTCGVVGRLLGSPHRV